MPQFRIVFHLPEQAKSYYRRHVEMLRVNGIPRTGPEITTLAHDCAKFTSADLAVTARDRFRADFPRCTVYIEDLNGNGPLFERREVESATEDHRGPVWVIPDGCEESQMGYLVMPAFTSHLGRCWAVRSKDIPSVVASGRDSVLETVYASDPIAAVERAKVLWGSIMEPSANPALEAEANEQIKEFVAQIKDQGKTGRSRPGDQRS